VVGSAGGQVVDLEPMLDEYYRIMGWDSQGIPSQKRLEELGLDKISDAGHKNGN
jgi:aldehyde:ferredoxin oxidoreductase